MRQRGPEFNFDFNGIDNGMMLPKKSKPLDMTGHGKHNSYNDAISEKISEIITESSYDDLGKLKEIRDFIKKTKETLKNEVLLGNKNVNDITNF